MNRLITLIALCISASAAFSQEKADIEVSYSFEFPNFMTGERNSRNQYILLAGPTTTKFYSPRTEYIDSLTADPNGSAKLREMQKAALKAGNPKDVPRRDGSFYVYKSGNGQTVTYYDLVMQDYLCCTEKAEPIDWQLTDTTKTILGYQCILATAHFHGRTWQAWFTTDIPIQEGPWKLGGLPGLILEAETADGNYLFTATGLQHSQKTITPICLADRYEKMSRTDLWKAKRAFIDNPMGTLNAQIGSNVKVEVKDENGKNVSINDAFFTSRDKVDFLETDY